MIERSHPPIRFVEESPPRLNQTRTMRRNAMVGPNVWTAEWENRGASIPMRPNLSGNGRSAVRARAVLQPPEFHLGPPGL